MPLRFEAWTLPWSTSFERVIADLPAIDGSSGLVRLNDYGEGNLILPEDYDRLSDVISSTVGTLIRVYDGTTIVQEFLAERVERSNSDSGTVTVSGPDLADVFNRTSVYPFDYPDNPSAFPDHVWGGANLLSNPGFEDGLGANDVWEVYVDATGGTFTLTVDGGSPTVALDHDEDTNTMELRLQDLANVDDVTVTGEGTIAVYEIEATATGGTFTITVDGDTTSGLAYNASAGTIETAIGGLDGIVAVSVSGSGTGGDPWEIRFENPADPGSVSIDTSSLTGGSATLTTVSNADPYIITFFAPTTANLTGDDSSLAGGGATLYLSKIQTAASDAGSWTTSRYADQSIDPRVHGESTISVTTSVVDTGTYALLVNATAQFGGAQQVVQVEPGGTYQASIRIRSTGTGPFRFVIRDLYENVIAAFGGGVGFTVTANTWTTVTLTDIVIPAGVEAVIFRIAYIGTGTSTFYIDNAEFNEGMAESNVGEIVAMLMDDAAVDHALDTRGTVLDWVDYTGFDSTDDSSSVAWPEDLSITAYAGMSYGQFFDSLVALGYDWRLTPKASPGATTHDLEWYAAGNLGTDHTSSASPAINFGQGTIGGPVVQRIPTYTRVLAIGADGAFVEDSDATALTNFGPFEMVKQDTAWSSTATLTAAADELLESESRNRVAVQVSVIATQDHPRPLVDYGVGDTLYFQIPPALPKTSRRVRSIAWRHTTPTTYQVTGSRIFDKESGAWEAVRRLLREFKKQPPKSKGGLSIGSTTIPWMVACSDAPSWVKEIAGYVCDGTDDQVDINSSLERWGKAWLYTPADYGGGPMATYYISDTVYVNPYQELAGFAITDHQSTPYTLPKIRLVSGFSSDYGIFSTGMVQNIRVENASATSTANQSLYYSAGRSFEVEVWVALDGSMTLNNGCELGAPGIHERINVITASGEAPSTFYGALVTSGARVRDLYSSIDADAWAIYFQSTLLSHIHASGLRMSTSRKVGVRGAVFISDSVIEYIQSDDHATAPARLNLTDSIITKRLSLEQADWGMVARTTFKGGVTGSGIASLVDCNDVRFGDCTWSIENDAHGLVIDGGNRCAVRASTFETVNTSGTTNTRDHIQVDGGENHQVIDTIHNPRGSSPVPRYALNIVSGTRVLVDRNDWGDASNYGTGAFNDSGTSTRTGTNYSH